MTSLLLFLHRIGHIVILASSTVLCLYILYPLVEPGIPVSWDAATHYARLVFVTESLIPKIASDGWYWWGFNGYRTFQFYSPFFYFFTGLLKILSGGLLSLETTLKLVLAMSFIALPLSMYYFLRTLTIDPIPSAVGASAVTIVSVPYGTGILSLFLVGLLPQAFGLPLLLVTLGMISRSLINNNTRLLLISCILTLVLFKTHFVTTYYLLIAATCLILHHLLQGPYRVRTLTFFIVFIVLFVLMSAPDLYLIFGFKDEMGYATGFGPPQIFKAIADDPARKTALFLCLGMLALSTGYRNARIYPLILLVLTFLITGIGIPDFGMKVVSYPLYVLKNRSFSMFFLFGSVLTAVLVSAFLLWVPTQKLVALPEQIKKVISLIVITFLIVIPSTLTWYFISDQRQFVKTEYHVRESIFKMDFDRTLTWIRENTDPMAGIVVEDIHAPIETKGYGNLHAAVAFKAKRRALLDGFVEATRSSSNIDLSEGISSWNTEEIYSRLAKHNLTHVITHTQSVGEKFRADPRFNEVSTFGEFSVWEAKNISPNLAGSNPDLKIQLTDLDIDHISWSTEGMFSNENKIGIVNLAVSYSPDWTILIDGSPADPPVRTERNMMSVTMPINGTHTIDLLLIRSNGERILRSVSYIVLIILVGIIFAGSNYYRSRKSIHVKTQKPK